MEDPTNFWGEAAEKGFLVLFMCVIIFFGGKWLVRQDERRTKQEDDNRLAYKALVDTVIEQTKSVAVALSANTSVMQRVERKLDEPRHPHG